MKKRLMITEQERRFLIEAMTFCASECLYEHNAVMATNFIKRLKKRKK